MQIAITIFALAALLAPSSGLAEPLSLERAIALARSSAPRRAAAVALAEGMSAAAGTAGRLPNPSLELRMENWRPHGGGAPLPDYYAVLSVPIELGGKRGVRRDVARADAGVAGEDLRAVEQRVLLAVAERYVAALHARGVVAAAREQRAGAAEVMRILRRRVDEGRASGSDLAKLEAELARLDTTAVRGEVEVQRAIADLAAALGPDVPLQASDLVEPAPIAAPDGTLERLAADARGRRPDVAAARARQERALQQLALERARAVPDVAIAGGWKRVDAVNTGVVALSVPLPFSDRNQSAIARAGGETEAAARELAAVEAEATADVRATVTAARTLTARAAVLDRDLVAPAEVVLRAARSRFREGGGDVLPLVDAERSAIEARREALDLHLDAVLAALRARAALGLELLG